jgi:V8-like Glu-specific endopeptidase
MKKQLLLISMLMTGLFSFGQVTDMGGPMSWKDKVPSYDKVPLHIMPGFDLEQRKIEDEIRDAQKNQPWRFGFDYSVDISPDQNGEWIDLKSGRLWRVGIECPGAVTVNLLLEDYDLPKGASLYLFDADETNRVGAYTSRNNRTDGLLGTELVHGNKIVVEYYEPNNVSGIGNFKIAHVIHGYRTAAQFESPLMKALNSSGDCNIDIHCPLGVGWENQVRSVALINVSGSAHCSGALINNTCEDGTPYFLTANHCMSANPGNMTFRFNWASPPGTESCATTAGSVDPGAPYDETANGATTLVSGGQADHALLEIDNMTITDAQNWNLFYAGWNNDDTDGSITEATSIHHPSGDVMKICREDDSPYHNSAGGADVWYIDQWEEGVTEPGSSGSPLFDQNGRIIGQLYGGAAACSGTVNNGSYDYYGRLGVSWLLGIGDYLDPVGCGGTNIVNDGWDPNGPAMPDDASIQSVESPTGTYCQDLFYPQVRLRNAGGNDLTSCAINYNVNGGSNLTYNWSGLLAPNGTEVVNLPAMSAGGGVHTFNAFTTSPNGNTDTNPVNDASVSNFEIIIGGFETTVSITTDCYGYETYWEIVDVNSSLVASGGNSIGIAPGGQQISNSGDPDSYGSSSTTDVMLCLAEGCYDFTIYDDWGDGVGPASFWCQDEGDYVITNSSQTVLAQLQDVAFGDSETQNFCVVDNTGLDEFAWLNLQVYPNPNNGSFALSIDNTANEEYVITITDLSGRAVYNANMNTGLTSIDLNNASNGSYLINLKGARVNLTRSIVINK